MKEILRLFGKSNSLKNYEYFKEHSKSDIHTNERFQEKLDFLALSKIRRESVIVLKEIYDGNREYILNGFYTHLLEIPEFKKIIIENSSVERLKKTFDLYFASLSARGTFFSPCSCSSSVGPAFCMMRFPSMSRTAIKNKQYGTG